MSKVLVTGGTGYIGSHTVVELIEAGFDVVVIDNFSNSDISVLDGIEKITGHKPEFFQIDLKDKNSLVHFFDQNSSIDSIIHFAAYKAVGESVEKPLKYYRNNLLSTMHLLECMEEYNVKNIVFSSSCTVYGQPDKLPVDEAAPIKEPLSPYGSTKQISERMIHDATQANDLIKGISLRYFNPIGAHPSALIGEKPHGIPDNLLPFITQTALGLRKELKVFGDDYNTPDGTAIRDYINVVDLAKAHVKAIRRLQNHQNKTGYEFFNVGTGKGNSVMEIIKAFEKATGERVNYQITGRRSGDVEQVYADTRYANKELGWEAEVSLEETLRSAWNWEKYIRSKQ
ncbi:MAG: UDP-glucose 4-epimerase GalE [Bacteroidota bacterium]